MYRYKSFLKRQVRDFQLMEFRTFVLLKVKTFLYLIVIFPFYITAFIFCLLMRILSVFLIIRVGRISAVNFGNLAEDPARYLCKKKLNLEAIDKKKIDLFYFFEGDFTPNTQLIKMWKRELNVLPKFFLHPIYEINNIFPDKLKFKIISLEENFYRDISDLVGRFRKNGSEILKFTNEEEQLGQNLLKKIGINKSDKFICLAVRDEEYQKLKSKNKNHDWSYHSYRNYNIDKFILTAEELTKMGYYVIRMGVKASKPFISNNPKIIDYANSNIRNNFLDVYLGAKCSLCISTGLGFDQVPYVFGVPLALINMPVGDLRLYSEKIIVTTREHLDKKSKKKLSLNEIFSSGMAYCYSSIQFKKNEIEIIELKNEDIRDFALEAVNIFQNNYKLSEEEQHLQKKFKETFLKNHSKFKHLRTSKNKSDEMHKEIKSYFSPSFLRKNQYWLNYDVR